MTTNENLAKSNELMDGHKWEAFVLGLSFLGWGILATISIVGLFFLEPYIELSIYHFYQELLGNDGSKTINNATLEL